MNREDIYYIVTIKEEYQEKLKFTTIKKSFCGKLVQTGSTMLFELNGIGAYVLIPFKWIESMAPSKVLWELKQKNFEKKYYCKWELEE